MLPNFMLIGTGRAGSDWITRNLSLHPDIFMPRQKSTSFFTRHYDKGIDWYSRRFGSRKENAVGEATVGYLHNENVPELVARHIPDVKLIANLRDPVDRAYSSYGRLLGKARPGDTNFHISFEEKIQITPRLLEIGLYAQHLQRWFEYFPRENFLILTFDEMKQNPDRFLTKIYSFLGVNAQFQSPLVHQRLNSTAALNATSKVAYNIYRGLLRFKFFGLSNAFDVAQGKARIQIDPNTRRRLIETYFGQDLRELESIIGKSLSNWKE